MELVEGRTLHELMAAGPLPIKRVLPLAAQASEPGSRKRCIEMLDVENAARITLDLMPT